MTPSRFTVSVGDFENIHSFKERIPDALIHTLDLNYRSTQEILDLSNWLLAHSPIDYQNSYRLIVAKDKSHNSICLVTNLKKPTGLHKT